jgi:NAD-dependent SIR2 family protein deacetylase
MYILTLTFEWCTLPLPTWRYTTRHPQRHIHTGRVETMAAGSGVAALGDEVGADFSAAAAYLRSVRDAGGRLHILSGAGMSVCSGVPVFRNSDGTMSDEFLAFLSDYNAARTAHGLPEVDDWFGFSVPQMFAKATEKAAWAYWRWRTLRAMVTPADDYRLLQSIIQYFGEENVFVTTSNCDMLHVLSGTSPMRLHEIHGCLGRVQCSNLCCDKLYPVDEVSAGLSWIHSCTHVHIHTHIRMPIRSFIHPPYALDACSVTGEPTKRPAHVIIRCSLPCLPQRHQRV